MEHNLRKRRLRCTLGVLAALLFLFLTLDNGRNRNIVGSDSISSLCRSRSVCPSRFIPCLRAGQNVYESPLEDMVSTTSNAWFNRTVVRLPINVPYKLGVAYVNTLDKDLLSISKVAIAGRLYTPQEHPNVTSGTIALPKDDDRIVLAGTMSGVEFQGCLVECRDAESLPVIESVNILAWSLERHDLPENFSARLKKVLEGFTISEGDSLTLKIEGVTVTVVLHKVKSAQSSGRLAMSTLSLSGNKGLMETDRDDSVIQQKSPENEDDETIDFVRTPGRIGFSTKIILEWDTAERTRAAATAPPTPSSSLVNSLEPQSHTLSDILEITDNQKTLEEMEMIESVEEEINCTVPGLGRPKRELFERLSGFLIPKTTASSIGLVNPRALVLHGPAGCGKLLLAKDIRNMIPTATIRICSAYQMGDSAFLHSVFDAALDRGKSMLVVVIREFHLLFTDSEYSKARSHIVGVIDNEDVKPEVLIIGLTSKKELIDSEMFQKGRIDGCIPIGYPSRSAREQIIVQQTSELSKAGILSKSFDPARASEIAVGYTGSDIAQAINTARCRALTRHAGLYRVTEQKDWNQNSSKITIATQDIVDALRFTATGQHKFLAHSALARHRADFRTVWRSLDGIENTLQNAVLLAKALASPRSPTKRLSLTLSGNGALALAATLITEGNFSSVSYALSSDLPPGDFERASKIKELVAPKGGFGITILGDIERLIGWYGFGGGGGVSTSVGYPLTLGAILDGLQGYVSALSPYTRQSHLSKDMLVITSKLPPGVLSALGILEASDVHFALHSYVRTMSELSAVLKTSQLSANIREALEQRGSDAKVEALSITPARVHKATSLWLASNESKRTRNVGTRARSLWTTLSAFGENLADAGNNVDLDYTIPASVY
mmetsp:Transcript_13966/g.21123  ORF Transcript_13966/g.21123 Transcript_13966/m.21123 type:complete len:895 (-) Transcript_13966:53-2737(-)